MDFLYPPCLNLLHSYLEPHSEYNQNKHPLSFLGNADPRLSGMSVTFQVNEQLSGAAWE